jgi:dipeptidyl aminopeptidase/acylaminoacyl peptidase
MRGFEPSDVWSIKGLSDLDLSPDGKRLAHVVSVPDKGTDSMSSTIWTLGIEGGSRQFSYGEKDSFPRWSPDGRYLAFLRTKEGKGQIMVASLDGGEPLELTSEPLGVSYFAWSPDGSALAYVAKTKDGEDGAEEAQQQSSIQRSKPTATVWDDLYNRFDGIGRFDDGRSHIFITKLQTPKDKRQLTKGDFDDFEPIWSPDGKKIAFTSDRTDQRGMYQRRDLWIVDVEGDNEPIRLTNEVGTAASPQFSPDGSLISFVGHENDPGDSSKNSELRVVLSDGSGKPRSLTGSLDRPVWGVQATLGKPYVWSDDGSDTIYFLANDGGRQGIFSVSVREDQPQKLELVFIDDLQIMNVVGSKEHLFFLGVWAASYAEVKRIGKDGSGLKTISTFNATLSEEVELRKLEQICYTTEDGFEIRSFVIYPKEFREGTPQKTVLEIHGGPHGWHPQASMMPLYQSLAAQGYVVVLPNPRGSHGFGERFSTACVKDWGGRDFQDLMGVLDLLIEKGVSDPKRLYVAGYSYGGYMTSWIIGHTSRFKAACISAPVTNLVSMYGTTDIPYFNAYESGGTPWEDPKYYLEHSPVTYLPQVTTPAQILHWEGDLRCPIGQGEEIFQGLRALGKEARMVRYPGGFHILRTPSQMQDYVERHLSWFDGHN